MEKSLHAKQDLQAFWRSLPAIHLFKFIEVLNASVSGKSNTYIQSKVPSPFLLSLSNLLTQLTDLILTIPVPEQASRFGHPVFRKWISCMEELFDTFLDTFINDAVLSPAQAIYALYHSDTLSGICISEVKSELKDYFIDSFGNRQRIDYGSGHELHFICFLYCLFRLNLFSFGDFDVLFMDKKVLIEDALPSSYEDFGEAPLIVLLVFRDYILLMRHLQRAFWLEPAGSQGVWGLDDYHFIPFLFGSSQLIGHPILRPKSIHVLDNLEMFSNQYIYFDAIKFIRDLKDPALGQKQEREGSPKKDEPIKQLSSVTSPLRWHSPLLDDISGAKNWQKVNQGLLKMYYHDVLHKLPIMQHFLVGKLFIPKLFVTMAGTEVDQNLCHHATHSLPDCCGIRLPSAMAAAASNVPRKIPFD